MVHDKPTTKSREVELDPSKLLGWSHLAELGASHGQETTAELGRLLSKRGEAPVN